MSSFWVCFYHMIWATDRREPVITAARERQIFDAIWAKSEELKSPMMAINGVEDHIHVAVCIHPSISVSAWVEQVKEASSHAVNMHDEGGDRFRWQTGYGTLTHGKQDLKKVVTYIAKQKQHHQSGKIVQYLEQIDDDAVFDSVKLRST